MALWQYVVFFVSEAQVASDGTVTGLVQTGRELTIPQLSQKQSEAEFEALCSAYLPSCKSWSESIRMYGNEQADDLSFVIQDGKVVEARARLDLRSLTREKVLKLVELARAMECRFIDAQSVEVLPATPEALLGAIRQSPAARFVEDPHGYLRSIAGKKLT